MIRGMATRDRPLDRANRTATAMVAAAAEELRRARTNGGLSQRDVAQAAGVSHATVSRIERAASPEASLIVLARLASVVGLNAQPSLRIPTAIRSGTWRTFGCWSGFHGRLHPDLRWRTEVPLLIHGDLRAWDATIARPRTSAVGVEAGDAVARRSGRSPGARTSSCATERWITSSCSSQTREPTGSPSGSARTELGAAFPVSQRDCLRALREGRDPGGSAIIVL